MARVNSGKVEFYRVMIYTVMSLIEDSSGNKLDSIDATIEDKVATAVAYGNVSELKKLHSALDEMYKTVKKKARMA